MELSPVAIVCRCVYEAVAVELATAPCEWEQRVDPDESKRWTFAAYAARWRDEYSLRDIKAYWMKCCKPLPTLRDEQERRVDPDEQRTWTWPSYLAHHAGTYDESDIWAYWQKCCVRVIEPVNGFGWPPMLAPPAPELILEIPCWHSDDDRFSHEDLFEEHEVSFAEDETASIEELDATPDAVGDSAQDEEVLAPESCRPCLVSHEGEPDELVDEDPSPVPHSPSGGNSPVDSIAKCKDLIATKDGFAASVSTSPIRARAKIGGC